MSERKIRKYSGEPEEQISQEIQHPLKTYLFYGLTISSVIFLSVLFVFFIWIDNKPDEVSFHLSKAFIISPYFLLISFFASTSITRAYRNDNNIKLLTSLSISLFAGVVFSVLQVYACFMIFDSIQLNDFNPGYIVIFASTGLHLLFVAFGLIYLFYLTLKAYDNWNDPIKALIYFSNDYEVSRLELASIYWYYTCISWALLFFVFLIAS